MKHIISGLLLAVLCAACGAEKKDADSAPVEIDELARSYLILELAMGLHDAGHVDAYFGPDELRLAAEEQSPSLEDLDARAADMATRLRKYVHSPILPEQELRAEALLHRLTALRTRIVLNQGQTLDFDLESRRLFGTVAPNYDAKRFAAVLQKIDALLPGADDLSTRVNEFRSRFEIPGDRVNAVFDAAIAECRRRTLQHIALPPHESFTLEYVKDKPWSGYNWYQGNAQSLIQINTDLPININRAVDLGCHEGYPGHHTFNALVEQNLVNDKGWIEYSLYPLFSPQSLIAEGSGNYGIELAFPADERIEFEKSVLFPLAGLDVAEADRYYELLALLEQLSYAGNEAARDYLNGDIDRQQAIDWLVRYALSSADRAEQRVKFFDAYRSYVINYNLGKDLVRDYVERDGNDEGQRWQRFAAMLSAPIHPSDLE